MPAERIFATYRIETPLPIERAASVLAGEQSSGTFVDVPGETEELRNRYRARVERISELESVRSASLPLKKTSAAGYRRAEIIVSWSVENLGFNLPTLVSTLQGNLYELDQFSGLKLIDFDLPASFTRAYPGPRFGIEGTRQLTGVRDRPMIGTIIKPSIGMSPDETANLVAQLCAAGIDFIKDDELMANPPHSPFDRRVAAIMRVVNAHADRTGKRVMYAFNITDEIDAMVRNYELVHSTGNTGAMISLNSVGLCGVKKICDQGALAIHGHRNGFGMLNRHPMLGMDFVAYQKFWRLAGVDQLHVNGIANKFWEPDDSVVRSIEACRAPMLETQPILPVVSSGQTGLQAPETYRRTKTVDLLYLAGGGILAHPDGASAGVAAIKQAWEAAVGGVSLDEFARDHRELREQIEKFGEMNDLLISFYGDDFTGSTDALETLALAGVKTILFTRVPSAQQLAQYPGLRAFGVASTTRSMPPDQMEAVLRPALAALRELQTRVVHYKVCSTFDSSPTVGSIGRVIDIGMEIFSQRCLPVVAAAPALGRYCVFGNLFARCGSESEPYRLDRHPSMSRHPITPMDEADLGLHLSKQTDKRIRVLNVLQLEQSPSRSFVELLEAGAQVILIDLLYERHMEKIGEFLAREARFVVGSSGVTAAMCAYWRATDAIGAPRKLEPVQRNGPIVAVCGSNSPVAKQQIDWAGANGFTVLPLDRNLDDIARASVDSVASGKSVAIHSYTGAQDASSIGPALASILKRIVSAASVRRVLVAGGDTSGQIAHELQIESLEMIGELTRGAPLCRATAPGSPADGIEITFKGGQIGPVDFFGKVAG